MSGIGGPDRAGEFEWPLRTADEREVVEVDHSRSLPPVRFQLVQAGMMGGRRLCQPPSWLERPKKFNRFCCGYGRPATFDDASGLRALLARHVPARRRSPRHAAIIRNPRATRRRKCRSP